MLIGIFGTGRNGSTLLGRLLDGLESTYVHPVEENFLSAMADLSRFGHVRRTTGHNCTSEALPAVIDAVSAERLSAYYQITLDQLADLVHKNLPADPMVDRSFRFGALLPASSYRPADFVGNYLRAVADRVVGESRVEHLLFKTIETPYVADYAHCFPEMRFVHIVRDPVVVCSSQKRTLMEKKHFQATYLGFDWLICMLEKRWIPHARQILAFRGDSRHQFVRYEDLVNDPAGEVRRLAAGLGLAPPPRPTLQTIFGDKDFRKLDSNPSKAGVETPREAVANLHSSMKYEELLTEREIDLINYKTAELQEQLGYRPAARPSLGRVLREYATVDRWEWANVRGAGGIARALFGAIYRRVSIFDRRGLKRQ